MGSSYYVDYAFDPSPTRVTTVEADWVHRVCRYIEGGQPTMDITVSRLTPAVMFKTDRPQLSFFRGMVYNGLSDGHVNETPIQVPVTRKIMEYMKAHPGEFPEPTYEEWLIDWDGLHRITTPEQTAKLKDSWGYIKIAYIPIRPIAVAVPEADGVKVYTKPGTISLDKQTEPWLLFWFGELSPLKAQAKPMGRNYPSPDNSYLEVSQGLLRPADCPVMLNLQNKAKELVLAADGVSLKYNGPAGAVSILPPLGMRFPDAAETEKWRNGLPA